ncbi:MAG: LysM peptidoglycan-binding domain-containing protein [Bacteroidales bacterium]|jgi:LysM repeat protein|nr:LysM peptidoglycan-binding domain-containing protein [Bacteroidales bacterium]
MAQYKEVYITIEDFAVLQNTGRQYEGFVIGLGYAFVDTTVMSPPNLRGYTNSWGIVPPAANKFNLLRFQYVDNSPQMVEMSLKGAVAKDEYYTVKKGDTLSALAKQFKVTVDDLVKWNRIAAPDKIAVGERLVVGRKNEMGQRPAKDKTRIENSSERKAADNQEEIFNYLTSGIGAIGTGFSTVAGARYTQYPWGGGSWIGRNGKMYDMSLITGKGKGYNLYQNSANIAKNATKIPRVTGNILGGLTTLYSGYKFWDNPNWSDGFDVAGGIGGLIYLPVGLAYLYVRFNIDVVRPDIQRHQLEMLERIDNGTFNPWDYRNTYPNLTGPCP